MLRPSGGFGKQETSLQCDVIDGGLIVRKRESEKGNEAEPVAAGFAVL